MNIKYSLTLLALANLLLLVSGAKEAKVQTQTELPVDNEPVDVVDDNTEATIEFISEEANATLTDKATEAEAPKKSADEASRYKVVTLVVPINTNETETITVQEMDRQQLNLYKSINKPQPISQEPKKVDPSENEVSSEGDYLEKSPFNPLKFQVIDKDVPETKKMVDLGQLKVKRSSSHQKKSNKKERSKRDTRAKVSSKTTKSKGEKKYKNKSRK